MKRCPQCEFIYEDEQSLCDMDGILLVFDTRQLPKHNALATPSKVPAATTHSRGRLFTMLAALVLATVLYLVYFVSTQQPGSRNSYSPAGISIPAGSQPTGPPQNEGSVAVPPNTAKKPEEKAAPVEKPVSTSTGEKEEKPKAEVEKEEKTPAADPGAKKEEPKGEAKPKAEPSKVPTKSKTSARAHPASEGSRITSFFKKTGRILKKPFKM